MSKINRFINTDISKLCFLVFFLLKPFYILPSGTLQTGDIFLVLSFGFLVYSHKFKIEPVDHYFFVFLLCVMLINGIYYLIYQKTGLLLACSYYIFNFMVISCFRKFSKDASFLSLLSKICALNLWIQVLMFVSGKGEYWAGTYRYMGTYNDPNQLGFAVVSTFFILYLLHKKNILIYFAISIFLIIQTSSTGMTAAILILMLFRILLIFKEKNLTIEPFHLMIIFVGIAVFSILLYKNAIYFDLDKFKDNIRIEQKLNRGGNIFVSFIRDRNLDVITAYPYYFLFGYGEGYFRYVGYLGGVGELHSTIISICFYYGIIPFLILLKWVIQNIKNVSIYSVPVYIALFAEALTLVNHRQPSFWIIIILGSVQLSEKGDNNEIQYHSTNLQYRKFFG